jgi:hypothetical protein
VRNICNKVWRTDYSLFLFVYYMSWIILFLDVDIQRSENYCIFFFVYSRRERFREEGCHMTRLALASARTYI